MIINPLSIHFDPKSYLQHCCLKKHFLPIFAGISTPLHMNNGQKHKYISAFSCLRHQCCPGLLNVASALPLEATVGITILAQDNGLSEMHHLGATQVRATRAHLVCMCRTFKYVCMVTHNTACLVSVARYFVYR